MFLGLILFVYSYGLQLPRNKDFINKVKNQYSIALNVYACGYNYLRSQSFQVTMNNLLPCVC